MTLYSSPATKILVNGTLSDPMGITNGTRQGCPLPPMLFALGIEHLARAIRHNPNIHGIHIPDHTYKLFLSADDLLLNITKTPNQITFPPY